MAVDYAYVHARPDGSIFYVGKGRGNRYLPNKKRNTHHKNIVKKYGADNILVGKIDCSSHETALDLEIGMIKCLKRMGVNLTNQTLGGDGALGRPVSSETRQKLHALFKGKRLRKSPITTAEREKIIAANRAKRIHTEIPEEIKHAMVGMTRNEKIAYRARLNSEILRERVLGEKNPMYGRTHSEEYKLRLSNDMQGEGNPFFGKYHSKETRNKMAAMKANKPDVQCPHCKKVGHPSGMQRWHFNHCRSK